MEHNRQKNKMLVEYEEGVGNFHKENKSNKEPKIYEIQIDSIKSKRQCKLVIQGVEVYFPYQPYSNQLAYMEKVIQACQSGQLAALESPTGTGKTLCLLCASLGWLRAKRKEMKEQMSKMSKDEAEEFVKNVPFIYYSSRTHSQLSNVIKELKKTCYLPRTATLSSRDQMCVNSAVKQFSGNLLNIKCKQVRFRKECKYFTGTDKLSLNAYDNTDIEELYQVAQKSGFCPFYFQRAKKEIADVLFLPYNYIFESKFREVLKINLKSAIILIDEAHNMENVCESSKSFEFSVKMIEECLNDLKQIRTMVESLDRIHTEKDSALKSIDVKKIKEEESILSNMKSYLKSINIKTGSSWPNYGMKLNPKEFFDVFFEGSKKGDKNQTHLVFESNDNTGLNPQNIERHVELLKKIETAIVDEFQKTSILSNYGDILELVSLLSSNYLQWSTSGDSNPTNCFVNNYKIFVNDVEDFNVQNKIINNKSLNNSKIRTLFLFCFNPGFGFKDILASEPQSLIISSGTLSPLESMETELKCNFPIKLENKHVIDKSQVNFCILSNSFKNKTNFRFDANSRNNTSMIEELGYTIADLCKVTPGGILVFFTAYNFMNNCISVWADKEILSEIEKSKEIFKDVHDSNKNKAILKNFTETCQSNGDNLKGYRSKKGGILFSVCRGSSSEGIDFSDDMARMVIIIGIPYPNLGDVKVNLKKEFLDEYNNKYFNHLDKQLNIKKLTSSEWYTQSATRAVNQALGRVIRHIDDYGSMILIDSRYKELLYKKVFSAWLRDCVKQYDDNKIILETQKFYESMKNYIMEKKNKRKEIKSNENIEMNLLNDYNTNDKLTNQMSNTNNININNKIVSSQIKLKPLNCYDLKRKDDEFSEQNNVSVECKRAKKIDYISNISMTNNTKNDISNVFKLSNNSNLNNFNMSNHMKSYDFSFNSNVAVNEIKLNNVSSLSSVRRLIDDNSTTSIIDDIKSKIDAINQLDKDISNNINQVNKLTEIPKILINNPLNKITNVSPQISKLTNNISHLDNIDEANIFDCLNQDELMDIINENINLFEDENNISQPHLASDSKNSKSSNSKKKVFRQTPSGDKTKSEGKKSKNLSNMEPNNLSQQFIETLSNTPNNNPQEIRSDILVRKLLELKQRDQLEFLLEKYNLKMCFDSQPMENQETKNNKLDVIDKANSSSKKIECPVCFESINKKFQAAKCGHILCEQCWDKCLENKLECPMCKKKVRKSTLVNIYL